MTNLNKKEIQKELDNICIVSAKRDSGYDIKNGIKWHIILKNTKIDKEINISFSMGIGFFVPQSWGNDNRQEFYIKRQLTQGDSVQLSSFGCDILNSSEMTKLNKFLKDNANYEKSKGGFTLFPPKIINLIFALATDAQAHFMSFEDFCANYVYNTDSIKDKKLYEECNESYFKLQKLGFYDIKGLDVFLEEQFDL